MKVALLHDYLNQYGGGEKCLDVFMELFPNADLFTIYHDTNRYKLSSHRHPKTSFIQLFPKIKHHRFYFLLFPLAVKSFRLDGYRLLLSSSHSYIKNVSKPKKALHICYIHTPMRYAWDLRHQYLSEEPFFLQPFIRFFLYLMRRWDKKHSTNVDFFIANSKNVQQRVLRYYGRQSTVIYPFVDCKKYTLKLEKEDFYLIVSRLISTKKIDLAIQAFRNIDKKLIIIGTGREENELKKIATSNTSFLGYLPEDGLISYYQRAKALIIPGVEDFGMTSIESQACGTPVIALGKGGLLESIIEGKTGHFFHEQTPEAIRQAIQEFEKKTWDPQICRKNALRFDISIFRKKLKKFINRVMEKKKNVV